MTRHHYVVMGGANLAIIVVSENTKQLHFVNKPSANVIWLGSRCVACLRKIEFFACRFSKEQMFSVVADVAHYENFVPFCTRSIVENSCQGYERCTLSIGFPPIVEKYTSWVTAQEPDFVKVRILPVELCESFPYLRPYH